MNRVTPCRIVLCAALVFMGVGRAAEAHEIDFEAGTPRHFGGLYRAGVMSLLDAVSSEIVTHAGRWGGFQGMPRASPPYNDVTFYWTVRSNGAARAGMSKLRAPTVFDGHKIRLGYLDDATPDQFRRALAVAANAYATILSERPIKGITRRLEVIPSYGTELRNFIKQQVIQYLVLAQTRALVQLEAPLRNLPGAESTPTGTFSTMLGAMDVLEMQLRKSYPFGSEHQEAVQPFLEQVHHAVRERAETGRVLTSAEARRIVEAAKAVREHLLSPKGSN